MNMQKCECLLRGVHKYYDDCYGWITCDDAKSGISVDIAIIYSKHKRYVHFYAFEEDWGKTNFGYNVMDLRPRIFKYLYATIMVLILKVYKKSEPKYLK